MKSSAVQILQIKLYLALATLENAAVDVVSGVNAKSCVHLLMSRYISSKIANPAVQDGIQGVLPAYRGTVHAVRCILAEEGWQSLYKGLSPALLGAGTPSSRWHP